MDKQLFRKKVLARRQAIYAPAIDEKIVKRFLESDLYQDSHVLMAYVSFDTEINTHPLIDQALKDGKQVILPICHKDDYSLILSEISHFPDDLQKGHFGLLEVRPDRRRIVDPTLIDLVIVPGCAFSKEGYRLGFGGGYYDRFLARLKGDCLSVGLVREAFVFTDIPLEAHDQRVNYLITEARKISLKEA